MIDDSPNDPYHEPLLLKTWEAARLISDRTGRYIPDEVVRKLIREGTLPQTKILRHIYIPRENVLRYIAALLDPAGERERDKSPLRVPDFESGKPM